MTRALPPASASNFESEALDALQLVRDAFARIIERKCPRSKAVTTLTDAFAIHRKLAWQVSKVAYENDPFVAARHMPTAKGVEVWLDAARSSGVPAAMVESARRAAASFEALAASHATSRDELDMLLESCSPGSDAQSHLRWREQSYNGNSFTWGACCKVLLAMIVFTPSEDRAGYFHQAQVRGLMGFRQVRPGVRWTVNQAVVADDSARAETSIRRVALDPAAAAAHGGVPVIPRFCSDPVPTLARRTAPDGMIYDEFVAGAVGLAGERTLVTGEVVRNIGPTHATENDKVAYFGTAVRVPSELLHLDFFVHRKLFGEVERELRVFSDLTSQITFDDADALPAPEPISRLGRGVALAQTPDIPAYADLAGWVFDALGTDAEEYDLFRVRMRYPPMPVTVMMRHDLPPAP